MASITRLYNVLMMSRSTFLMKNAPIMHKSFSTEVKESTKEELRTSLQNSHKPNDFEKKMLVWTGKYKTVEEVPPMINQDVMERARNRIRIKVANWMMLLTGLGCIAMIYSGKKAHQRGESVSKTNLQWHKDYNEQAKSSEKDYSSHFDKIAKAGAEDQKAAAVGK